MSPTGFRRRWGCDCKEDDIDGEGEAQVRDMNTSGNIFRLEESGMGLVHGESHDREVMADVVKDDEAAGRTDKRKAGEAHDEVMTPTPMAVDDMT